MNTGARLVACLLLSLCCHVFAVAQTDAQPAQAGQTAVTASANAERVRFSAPNSVAQLRLEVYDEAGRKLFDTEQRGGSVLDWHLEDGAGGRVSAGAYLCVLTVKDLSGHLRQKLGRVTVGEQAAEVKPVAASTLGPAQAQAVGPVEEDAALSVQESAAPPLPATVVAHDGTDGQLTRTRGALSFRLGDFFSGAGQEQMRLTEDGRLGVGTQDPQATLDVAGAVRASGGFRFSDGTTLDAAGGKLQLKNAAGDTIGGPSASGSGTQNQLAKWADSAGTLGDSSITEDSSGNVGVGTSAPGGVFDLQRSSQNDILQRFWNTGAGGAKLRYVAATGATSQLQLTDLAEWLMAIAGNNAAGMQFRVRDPNAANDEATLAASTRMTIARNGNVGIGATSPGVRLDVQGSVSTSNGVALSLTNHNGNNSNPWVLGTGGAVVPRDAFSIGDSSGYKMTFLANGSVGIGATNPLRTLQLGPDTNALFTFSPSDATPNAGYIRFGDHTGWKLHFARNRETSGGALNTGTVGELMTIQDNGNVGVGNTSPTFRLHVVDTSNTGLRVQTNITGGTVASFGANGDFQIDAVNVPGGRLIVKENGNVGIGTANLGQDPFRFGGSTMSRLTVKAAADACSYNCLEGQDGLYAFGGSKTVSNTNAKAGIGVIAIGGDASNGPLSGEGLVAIPGFADSATGSRNGRAGAFLGELEVDGDFFVTGSKNFLIDHPLDPENKYLKHAAIESSEVLDAYSGNVVTDSNGEAVVRLPEWFEALNRDLRYQLTVIGQFAQAIVASEVKDNRFTIKTSAPNVKVSWQVIGVRSDAYMRTHPFQAEEEKPARERGTYLSPEAFGQPEERSRMWAQHPELMREMKERREQAQRQKSP